MYSDTLYIRCIAMYSVSFLMYSTHTQAVSPCGCDCIDVSDVYEYGLYITDTSRYIIDTSSYIDTSDVSRCIAVSPDVNMHAHGDRPVQNDIDVYS